MDISQYFNCFKEIQISLLNYIERQDKIEIFKEYLFNLLNKYDIKSKKHELKLFLYLLSSIVDNYHRTFSFFVKIEQIIHQYRVEIQKNFSSTEIFEIFKRNDRIILYLVNEQIIVINGDVILRHNKYYFFPELLDEQIKNFESKRDIGENDSYICAVIRQDCVEEFISYVSRANLSLSKYKIKKSIFETNSFLIDKEPTIIEYAAFFGAIQIFQFLIMNNIKLTSSLWLYAIHSNNPEMIHLLEYHHVEPEDTTYEECLREAIKCHHNDIAFYFKNNIINEENFEFKRIYVFDNNLNEYAFRFYNFVNFPDEFESKFIFFYLCKFDYYTAVDFYLNDHKVNLKETVII